MQNDLGKLSIFYITININIVIKVLLTVHSLLSGMPSYGGDRPMQSSGPHFKKGNRGGFRDRDRDRDQDSYGMGSHTAPEYFKEPDPSK